MYLSSRMYVAKETLCFFKLNYTGGNPLGTLLQLFNKHWLVRICSVSLDQWAAFFSPHIQLGKLTFPPEVCVWYSVRTAEVIPEQQSHINGHITGAAGLCFSARLQKKDVHMLRFIQEVNTTTRSCALWDLDEDTEYIVHVQSISMGGSSPPSEPVLFRTPKESEKMASKSPGEGQ